MKRILLLALIIILLIVGISIMSILAQPQTPYMTLMLQCGGTLSHPGSPTSWHATEDEAKAYADSHFDSTYDLAYIMRPQSQADWTPLLWIKSTSSTCYNGAFSTWKQPSP